MPLTTPYNFVPINNKVYYPTWRKLVSQDIPFEDGEDGYIMVTLRNVSPLFTRNGAINDQDQDNKETMSSYDFVDANLNRRYFIPGTAIKGMLRATLEIMAFGKINEKQHYTNKKYEYRVRKIKRTYQKSITDMIRLEQPKPLNEYDLSETMFGTIANDKPLKGRIQVGHAFATQLISDDDLIEMTGVLGQPKASYYPLYVKQNKNPYKDYNTGNGMAGRKLYRIHASHTTMPLPVGNNNENVSDSFYALPTGNTFILRINVHNLKKVEIGALLSALTLHETNDAYHNIGLAKGFGFGKIKVEKIELYGLSYQTKDYELAFELTMDEFVSSHNNQMKWCETEQMTKLTNILREHDDKEVKVMELGNGKTEGTYGYYKNNKNFENKEIARLHESTIRVKSLINPLSVFRATHSEEYQLVDSLAKEKKYDEAIKVIDSIIEQMIRMKLNHDDEDALKTDIEKLKFEQVQELIEERKANEEAERQRRLQGGLVALIEEQYDNGTYKVTTMKTCFSKVNDWLKKSGKTELSEEEKDVLKHTLTRIVQKPDKKEIRDLKKFSNKLWQEVVKHLGDTVATELFGLLN